MYQNELICLHQLFFGTTEQSNKVDVKMTKEAKIYWVELEIQSKLSKCENVIVNVWKWNFEGY